MIEFQKRGLPHGHILIILRPEYKIMSVEQYDKFVTAKILDPIRYPILQEKVVKHMMHGPCGALKKNNPCIRDGKCRNNYHRPFSNKTMQSKDSHPIYHRRDDRCNIR